MNSIIENFEMKIMIVIPYTDRFSYLLHCPYDIIHFQIIHSILVLRLHTLCYREISDDVICIGHCNTSRHFDYHIKIYIIT